MLAMVVGAFSGKDQRRLISGAYMARYIAKISSLLDLLVNAGD